MKFRMLSFDKNIKIDRSSVVKQNCIKCRKLLQKNEFQSDIKAYCNELKTNYLFFHSANDLIRFNSMTLKKFESNSFPEFLILNLP